MIARPLYFYKNNLYLFFLLFTSILTYFVLLLNQTKDLNLMSIFYFNEGFYNRE